MDEATCTKQGCIRAKVVIVAWAMMGKAMLVAFRHLGLDIAGFGGIFVSREGKLEDEVSDFARNSEKRRGRLVICWECWF